MMELERSNHPMLLHTLQILSMLAVAVCIGDNPSKAKATAPKCGGF